MGWNQITFTNENCPLWEGIDDRSNVYFCHSYVVKPTTTELVSSSTEYTNPFTSSIWRDNLFGVQFHPEKSQAIGIKVLENFIKL